jgi:Lon protease-like protein
MGQSVDRRIALFPLGTVLFPEGRLPLRIFETRYVDMVRQVMREQTGFGVVLIRHGAEVGAVGEIAPVGTFARIVDFDQLPGGLLKIVARGERRFRVLSREVRKDGLHVAEVEWLEDVPEVLGEAEYPELRATLARVLAQLGDEYPAGEHRMDDALWVGGQLGQLLPAPAEFRQRILEVDGARARLGLLEATRTGSR